MSDCPCAAPLCPALAVDGTHCPAHRDVGRRLELVHSTPVVKGEIRESAVASQLRASLYQPVVEFVLTAIRDGGAAGPIAGQWAEVAAFILRDKETRPHRLKAELILRDYLRSNQSE